MDRCQGDDPITFEHDGLELSCAGIASLTHRLLFDISWCFFARWRI
jgi:hypothetical protein